MKLCERGKYGIGTARKDRKEMPEMPVDRQVKRDDFEFLYSDKVACCKWLNRRSVTMLFSNVEGMATTSTVPPPLQKGSASDILPRHYQNVQHRNGGGSIDVTDRN